MNTYRKKPVVIQAVQWTGTNESHAEICQLAGEDVQSHADIPDMLIVECWRIYVGDYVVKDAIGLTRCDQRTFELTYEQEVEAPQFRATDTVMGKPLNAKDFEKLADEPRDIATKLPEVKG